jgi:hypothetical protein
LSASWREDEHTGWKTASSAIPAHPEARGQSTIELINSMRGLRTGTEKTGGGLLALGTRWRRHCGSAVDGGRFGNELEECDYDNEKDEKDVERGKSAGLLS